MSTRRRSALDSDAGVAAVELGVLLMVMLLVAAMLFPVGQAIIEKIRLGRATGDALRFASAAPNTPAYGSSGRRPSVADIQAEAVRAYLAEGGKNLTAADVEVTTSDVPGGTVSIRIHKTVDLGVLGSFLSDIHVINSPSMTVAVHATGREE